MDKSSRGRMNPKLLPAASLAAAAIILAITVILATRPAELPASDVVAQNSNLRESRPLRPMEAVARWPRTLNINEHEPDSPSSWEEKLDAILSGEGSNNVAVRRLLQNFDRLPPEAQTEFIAHALNLCEDEDFSLMEPVYLRSDIPAEVREQIFDDAFNRPDEIKLPLMARTMTMPNQPLQEQAREILCLYLDVDPDITEPIDWNDRVRRYLQINPSSE